MSKAYFTVDEVAEKIGVHTKTVRRYIYSGKISAQKIAGQWRVTEEALETYLSTGCCGSEKDQSVSKDDFLYFHGHRLFWLRRTNASMYHSGLLCRRTKAVAL